MTEFEKFAQELNVEITHDKIGLYSGLCLALANITTDIILSDDETVFQMGWEEQKELIKDRFFRAFPYMKKN